MSKTDKNDSKATTLSEKRRQLDELLAWFEGDDFELDQALAQFESAEKLASEIKTELETYQNKIEVLKQRFDQ